MAKWFWWIVTGCVAICSLAYCFNLFRAYLRKRRALKVRAAGRASEPKPSMPVVRFAKAIETTWKDIAYLRTLPLWIYSHTDNAEIFWTLGYTAACIALGLYPTICE
jgi:hypothetical protein